MTPRILVTGAAGFLGGHVVRRLLEQGVTVRALVRRASGLSPEVGAVELLVGDVTDPAVLQRGMLGVETVLHLAACARVSSPDPAEFQRVNVDGVARLLTAARHAGVRTVVHVSTVLTLPPFRPAPFGSGRLTPYEATKSAGERLVEAYAAAGDRAVIVHPTRVYGPGPLHAANGVTRAIALYLRGRLRARIADGDVLANYVHADDVAAGVILAARQGRSGAHYVLGGENVAFRELLERVAGIAGVRRAIVALPRSLAMAVGLLAECWGYLGGNPPISRGWIRSFLEDRRTDSSAATHDFGYHPRDLATGLRETISWLGRTGHGKAVV